MEFITPIHNIIASNSFVSTSITCIVFNFLTLKFLIISSTYPYKEEVTPFNIST